MFLRLSCFAQPVAPGIVLDWGLRTRKVFVQPDARLAAVSMDDSDRSVKKNAAAAVVAGSFLSALPLSWRRRRCSRAAAGGGEMWPFQY